MLELSLYYDGLLDGEKRKEVETWLNDHEESKCLLQVFERFDSALETDLPDDQLESLLGDNLKSVHERLIQEDPQRRKESVSLWDWLLMPRNLLAGLAGLLVLFGLYSAIVPMEYPGNPALVASAVPTPTPTVETDEPAGEKSKEPVVNEAQKQVILAAAGLAKRAFSSGVDYAKEQGKPLGESLKVLPQTADLRAVLQSFASTGDQESESNQYTTQKELSPGDQLARSGAKQLAIGLGASLLSLISVI